MKARCDGTVVACNSKHNFWDSLGALVKTNSDASFKRTCFLKAYFSEKPSLVILADGNSYNNISCMTNFSRNYSSLKFSYGKILQSLPLGCSGSSFCRRCGNENRNYAILRIKSFILIYSWKSCCRICCWLQKQKIDVELSFNVALDDFLCGNSCEFAGNLRNFLKVEIEVSSPRDCKFKSFVNWFQLHRDWICPFITEVASK